MEDQLGDATAGSHFEKTFLFNELMTGSVNSGDTVITELYFQFLQDTG